MYMDTCSRHWVLGIKIRPLGLVASDFTAEPFLWFAVLVFIGEAEAALSSESCIGTVTDPMLMSEVWLGNRRDIGPWWHSL